MSTHSAGRQAAVKAGCKPVHFSLDGCSLSCYFSGSVATLRDTLSTSRSVGRWTGTFIYLPPFSENSPIFCSFPFAKIQPVFLPEQTGRKKHRTTFPPSATPAGITHYTLQAKSCANGSKPPLETPTRKGGMRPVEGQHTAFSCLKAWLAAILRYFCYPYLKRTFLTSGTPRIPAIKSVPFSNHGCRMANGVVAVFPTVISGFPVISKPFM